MQDKINALEEQVRQLSRKLEDFSSLKSKYDTMSARLEDAFNIILKHQHRGYDRTTPLSASQTSSYFYDDGDNLYGVPPSGDSAFIQLITGTLIVGPRSLPNSFFVSNNGDVIIGNGNVTNTSVGGFFYIPSIAGAPTGVPTNGSGGGIACMVYDETNNKLYMYGPASASWKSVTLT